MWETYRMLGKEREADLLREAERLHAAAAHADRMRPWSAVVQQLRAMLPPRRPSAERPPAPAD